MRMWPQKLQSGSASIAEQNETIARFISRNSHLTSRFVKFDLLLKIAHNCARPWKVRRDNEENDMKLGTTKWMRRLLVLTCALGVAIPSAHAKAKPQPMKVGQTVNVTLDAKGSKDYSLALGKGSYRLVWDARRVDGESSNVIGTIRLLKPNGVVIDSQLLNFNETGVTHRVGTVLNVPKPFVARFRMENDYAYENWFTVVPVSAGKRVPFGWGAGIKPARISSDNGVGGTFEGKESVYYSIMLPKGKWSISLGLELPKGEDSNLMGIVDLLDTLGFTKKASLVFLNDTGTQARQEGVITVAKPTPFLLRVINGSNDKIYTYDVTIEPAS